MFDFKKARYFGIGWPVLALATVTFSCIGLLLWSVPSWSSENTAHFCRDQLIHDYEQPLKSLPVLRHRVPSEGLIPFAPHDIRLERTGFNRIVEPDVGFGYRFRIDRATYRSGALRRPLKLHWKVATTLRKISRIGQTQRVIAMSHKRLPEVRYAKQLEFLVSAGVGIYRLDIFFEKYDGRKLGHYSEYFRVTPVRVNVRIAVSATSFHPGETAFSRIDNFGTAMVLVPGEAPSSGIERYKDGVWKEVPRESETPVIDTEEFILGGYAGSCLGFRIPESASSGVYRFARHVNPFGPYRSRLLTAEFSVQP